MSNDRFSIDSHKVHLHPERLATWVTVRNDWERAKHLFPLYVEVSPVSYCNHACSFCGVDYMLQRDDRPLISLSRMEALLTEMGQEGVKSVMFAGAGEPLLYKGLAQMIAHAGRVGIDTSITTNAVLLNEAFARAAFPTERLRWIKASINGGDDETYQRIHHAKKGDFDKVLRNLEMAVRVRREQGSRVTLGAQIVALPQTDDLHPKSLLRMPSNIPTIVPLAKRLRDIGIDYLVVKPYSQHQMSTDTRVYEKVNYRDANTWIGEAEAISTDTFSVVVRTQSMEQYDESERGYDKCHATPFLWAYVEADGNVWGCSAYLGRTEGDKQFGDDRFRYGNLAEGTFGDIWRGERRRLNWEYVRTELDISECRKNCRMHHANLYMERLVNPGPHDSFI